MAGIKLFSLPSGGKFNIYFEFKTKKASFCKKKRLFKIKNLVLINFSDFLI
jgi:hypothetical protein